MSTIEQLITLSATYGESVVDPSRAIGKLAKQALAELESKDKALAEMRRVLEELKREHHNSHREAQEIGNSDGFTLWPQRLFDMVVNSLSSDCGKDYVPKSQLDSANRRIEKLLKLVELLECKCDSASYGGFTCPRCKALENKE